MLNWWHLRFLLPIALCWFPFSIPLGAQQAIDAMPSPSLGSVLFQSNCGACHGSDGRGGERAPNIATTSQVKQLSNSALVGILRDGISGAGMPAFESLGRKKDRSYCRVSEGLAGK